MSNRTLWKFIISGYLHIITDTVVVLEARVTSEAFFLEWAISGIEGGPLGVCPLWLDHVPVSLDKFGSGDDLKVHFPIKGPVYSIHYITVLSILRPRP